MVVNYTEAGWEIVTQRAHGIVAAQLATNWKFSKVPTRWTETILAIAEHDDAEIELDGEHLLTDQGGPLNFSMKTFDLAHCEQVYRFAISKSRHIALLTSMHMDFLYRKEEKDNQQAHTFLQEQRKMQTQWRKELKLSKDDAQRLYALLQWCDACSLLICQRQIPPEQRPVQICAGPDRVVNHLVQLNEDELSINPWPFAASKFDIRVEYRIITKLQFESSAGFRKAFLQAPVSEKVWSCKQHSQ